MAGCTKPVTLRQGDYVQQVRCGRCRYCRIRRKMQWVGRFRLEALDHYAVRFITLTYREDPGVLNYADMQAFLKSWRYYYGRFRYAAVGEYGEKSGRGHWHVLIFGSQQEVIGHWKDCKAWEHGFVFDGNGDVEALGYVAGYTMKNLFKEERPIFKPSLRPGIGMPRLEKLGEELASRHQQSPLGSWPAFFGIGDRRYPLCDGGMRAVQRGFIDAGGLPPVEQTPDERHVLALGVLSDLGSQRRSDVSVRAEFMRRTKREGLNDGTSDKI